MKFKELRKTILYRVDILVMDEKCERLYRGIANDCPSDFDEMEVYLVTASLMYGDVTSESVHAGMAIHLR